MALKWRFVTETGNGTFGFRLVRLKVRAHAQAEENELNNFIHRLILYRLIRLYYFIFKQISMFTLEI